jgi:hypothetical protein
MYYNRTTDTPVSCLKFNFNVSLTELNTKPSKGDEEAMDMAMEETTIDELNHQINKCYIYDITVL